ncbi:MULTISPECIES: ABC transporter permease [Planococcus]|uniref:Choline ABC transporter permease n=2 Tax=Planococcus TaxID=1372 RepID=A0A1C7DT06_9BACL|nr:MULTISPECIES: ABC transporter permease [Planococcus]ANU14468.1 choline ABC transporter permease [Planococcus halocryophilus]AQU80760.1 choline ABC transporter permease [Planococcus faecalis]EMF48110.1 L-proline glycine betaine ABC transport system permease protein ProW [Planococcus halocryophilus Or1]MDJ0331978.1 ABC transporter permease [Planococcus sp. S3-L1]OHX55748.1 choline ABC transporter permease [Planococcus faecalis]
MEKWLRFLEVNAPRILELTIDHAVLVSLAIIVALLIGIPLGIYLTTNQYLADTVLQIASITLTIPSIALFGVMIPIFSLINQGIGFVPAFVALVLYSQLPIIRNTYTGIKNVNPEMRDAAIGMGMKTHQRLLRVEIPNAMPVIMAGVRTAVIMNIGIAVIASYIGAGGLGVLITQGISRGDNYLIISGSIAVAILAIIADSILLLIQKRFTIKALTD